MPTEIDTVSPIGLADLLHPYSHVLAVHAQHHLLRGAHVSLRYFMRNVRVSRASETAEKAILRSGGRGTAPVRQVCGGALRTQRNQTPRPLPVDTIPHGCVDFALRD